MVACAGRIRAKSGTTNLTVYHTYEEIQVRVLPLRCYTSMPCSRSSRTMPVTADAAWPCPTSLAQPSVAWSPGDTATPAIQRRHVQACHRCDSQTLQGTAQKVCRALGASLAAVLTLPHYAVVWSALSWPRRLTLRTGRTTTTCTHLRCHQRTPTGRQRPTCSHPNPRRASTSMCTSPIELDPAIACCPCGEL